jgi:hypothetical protein
MDSTTSPGVGAGWARVRAYPARLARAATLLWAAAPVACGEPAQPAVTVDPVSFSRDRLLGLSDERKTTLAQLTAFGLAVADSTTTELGAPLVARRAEDRLIEIFAAELTLERNDVGDDVLGAQYLTNPQWELTVRHILFFSERWRPAEHRSEARAKAVRALEALSEGADFAETAASLSEEPGAEGRQGLLTPGREGSWVPEFWAAAVALEPGEISPVTETQYGYHILRLEDRQVVPFTEARSAVARAVADQIEDPGAVLEAWLEGQGINEEEAGRTAALEEARRRGLTVSPAERDELERRWEDQVYQWAAALGFRYGLAPAEVAEAALVALADPAQGADIARRELAGHEDLLRARYDMHVAAPEA